MARLEVMVWVLIGVGIQTSLSAGVWGRKVEEREGGSEWKEDGEGTYNPKSAWMIVDSRRRVLPDIDVEAHFASVENHILSDIHSYHSQQMNIDRSSAEDKEMSEEQMDQYIISRFTPERASWRSQEPEEEEASDSGAQWWDSQEEDVAEARQGVGQFDEYLDSQTDSSYAETVNTVQSVDVVDRQFTTVGLPSVTSASTDWAQTFVNGSAVALLAFLFLLNLTQVLHSPMFLGGK